MFAQALPGSEKTPLEVAFDTAWSAHAEVTSNRVHYAEGIFLCPAAAVKSGRGATSHRTFSSGRGILEPYYVTSVRRARMFRKRTTGADPLWARSTCGLRSYRIRKDEHDLKTAMIDSDLA